MYLLKPHMDWQGLPYKIVFTFHNVPIKTWFEELDEFAGIDLHSTMYLLKQTKTSYKFVSCKYLHSTMYLLKHLYSQ